MKQTSFVMRLL